MSAPAVWVNQHDLETKAAHGVIAAEFQPTPAFVPLYREAPIDVSKAVKGILRALKDRSGFEVLDNIDTEIEAEIISELEEILKGSSCAK